MKPCLAATGTSSASWRFTLHRGALSADTLGLQLAEAKDLLVGVQRVLVEAQAAAALAAQAPCSHSHCATPRRHKDTRATVVRSLFGTPHRASPRWWHCACRPQPRRTFTRWPCCCRNGPPQSWATCRPLRRRDLLRTVCDAAG